MFEMVSYNIQMQYSYIISEEPDFRGIKEVIEARYVLHSKLLYDEDTNKDQIVQPRKVIQIWRRPY